METNQNTETKKQEAIRLAYGDYWEKCKNYIDKNGWCNVRRKVNFQEITDKLGWETKIGNQYVWRPKSLSGIEDNNGWTSILSEEDLPKDESKRYSHFHFPSKERMETLKVHIPNHYTCFEIERLYKTGLATHYRISDIIEPPIF